MGHAAPARAPPALGSGSVRVGCVRVCVCACALFKGASVQASGAARGGNAVSVWHGSEQASRGCTCSRYSWLLRLPTPPVAVGGAPASLPAAAPSCCCCCC